MAQLVEFRRPWSAPDGNRYSEGRQVVQGNYKAHPDYGKRKGEAKGLPKDADPAAFLPSTAKLLGKVKESEVEVEVTEDSADNWMEEAGGVSVSGPNKAGWFTINVEGEEPEKIQSEDKARDRVAELRKAE